MKIVLIFLVALGALVLLVSTSMTQRFRAILPPALRSKWLVLTVFIWFFIAGYLIYILMQLLNASFPNEILVSCVFLGGALFVHGILTLTGTTLSELKDVNDHLEDLVGKRTKQLTVANKSLLDSQNELSGKNSFLNSVLDALLHPLYVIDVKTHKIVLANKTSNLDLSQENKTCHWLSHNSYLPCDGDNHPCTIREIKKTGAPVVLEHIHKDQSEENRNVEVRGYPIYDDSGELIQVIEYVLDITNQKTAERRLVEAKYEAEEANRIKSEFLANMSHELRTPLNHIIGFSEIMTHESVGELNPKQKQFLQNVIQSSHNLLSLINDILELSRIEVGRESFNPQAVQLDVLIQQSMDMVKEKALKHNITIDLQYHQAIDALQADELKLKQILYNLLSNAVKFTPDGGKVTLTISPSIDEESGRKMTKFSIADTGNGIPEHWLDRIFQPFQQMDGSYSRNQRGTGLGLSLCKKMVEIHGGNIWAESDGPDKGSRFVFLLPLTPVIPGKKQHINTRIPNGEGNHQRYS